MTKQVEIPETAVIALASERYECEHPLTWAEADPERQERELEGARLDLRPVYSILRSAWEEELEAALAACYADHGLAIATLCDEHLDPKGALLGRVRDRALNATKEKV